MNQEESGEIDSVYVLGESRHSNNSNASKNSNNSILGIAFYKPQLIILHNSNMS